MEVSRREQAAEGTTDDDRAAHASGPLSGKTDAPSILCVKPWCKAGEALSGQESGG
jgi:hypothetical protein